MNTGPPLSPPHDIPGAASMENAPASTDVIRDKPPWRSPEPPSPSTPKPTTRASRPTPSAGNVRASQVSGDTGASLASINTPTSLTPGRHAGWSRPSTTRMRCAAEARAVSAANTTENTRGASAFSTQCAAVSTTRGATNVPVQSTRAASSGSPQKGETGTMAATAGKPSSGAPPTTARRAGVSNSGETGVPEGPHAPAASRSPTAADVKSLAVEVALRNIRGGARGVPVLPLTRLLPLLVLALHGQRAIGVPLRISVL